MSTVRACFALAAVALGVAVATTSCGSDETGTPGAGGGGIIGDAGDGGTSGIVGRSGSGGASGGGGVSGATSLTRLGSACINDAECNDPALTCVLPDSGAFAGEGPPKGLCTTACASDATCQAISPAAFCLNISATAADAFCFEGCTLGPTQVGDVKCHNRVEVPCAPLISRTTNTVVGAACVPVCTSDADCKTGTFCNANSGFCTTTQPPAGDPIGSDCDPTATAETCHGFCGRTPTASPVGTSPGTCTELCSFGQPCALAGTNNGGACVLITDPSEDIGDLGVCAQTCNCNSDCRTTGFSCIDWGNANVAALFNSAGFCFIPSTGDVTINTCPGAGGASGAGGGSGASGAGGGTSGAAGQTGEAGAAGGGGAAGAP